MQPPPSKFQRGLPFRITDQEIRCRITSCKSKDYFSLSALLCIPDHTSSPAVLLFLRNFLHIHFSATPFTAGKEQIKNHSSKFTEKNTHRKNRYTVIISWPEVLFLAMYVFSSADFEQWFYPLSLSAIQAALAGCIT